MRKKSTKAGYGILLYTALFSAAIITIAFLVATIGNTNLGYLLKTHVAGNPKNPYLGCGLSDPLLVDANLDTSKLFGTGTTAYKAFLSVWDLARAKLVDKCKNETTICNGGTILEATKPGQANIILRPPPYTCPDEAPPTTTDACRPALNYVPPAKSNGGPLFLIAQNGDKIKESDFARRWREACTIIEPSLGDDHNFVVRCNFGGHCACRIQCVPIVPYCRMVDPPTNATDNPACQGETARLPQGPVNGSGTSNDRTEAINKAIENAQSNLIQQCTDWDTVHKEGHGFTTIDCQLQCGADCVSVKLANGKEDYDPVPGPDGKPVIDNFTCTKVTVTHSIVNGVIQYTAKLEGCMLRCLMQIKCKKAYYVTDDPKTNPIPK